MSKVEEKPVSEYGEPWSELIFGFGWVEDTHGNEVNLMYERHRLRAIACVNALAGIPNPEAVRELIAAVREWTDVEKCVTDERIFKALAALSAPSTGAQKE